MENFKDKKDKNKTEVKEISILDFDGSAKKSLKRDFDSISDSSHNNASNSSLNKKPWPNDLLTDSEILVPSLRGWIGRKEIPQMHISFSSEKFSVYIPRDTIDKTESLCPCWKISELEIWESIYKVHSEKNDKGVSSITFKPNSFVHSWLSPFLKINSQNPIDRSIRFELENELWKKFQAKILNIRAFKDIWRRRIANNASPLSEENTESALLLHIKKFENTENAGRGMKSSSKDCENKKNDMHTNEHGYNINDDLEEVSTLGPLSIYLSPEHTNSGNSNKFSLPKSEPFYDSSVKDSEQVHSVDQDSQNSPDDLMPLSYLDPPSVPKKGNDEREKEMEKQVDLGFKGKKEEDKDEDEDSDTKYEEFDFAAYVRETRMGKRKNHTRYSRNTRKSTSVKSKVFDFDSGEEDNDGKKIKRKRNLKMEKSMLEENDIEKRSVDAGDGDECKNNDCKTHRFLYTDGIQTRSSARLRNKWVEINPFVYPSDAHDSVYISNHDLDLLKPSQFLNDTLIDFYIKYLKHTMLSSESVTSKFYFYSSLFFNKLTSGCTFKEDIPSLDRLACFRRVQKWTRKIDLFEYDFLVIPINFSLHWSLAIICHPDQIMQDHDSESDKESAEKLVDSSIENPPGMSTDELKTPCIIHFDSLFGDHYKLMPLIRDYLLEEWIERFKSDRKLVELKFKNVEIIKANVPQQNNFSDCGLFLLHYMELFLKENPSFINLSSSSSHNPLSFINPKWFKSNDASAKREKILQIILNLSKQSVNNQLHKNEANGVSTKQKSMDDEMTQDVDNSDTECNIDIYGGEDKNAGKNMDDDDDDKNGVTDAFLLNNDVDTPSIEKDNGDNKTKVGNLFKQGYVLENGVEVSKEAIKYSVVNDNDSSLRVDSKSDKNFLPSSGMPPTGIKENAVAFSSELDILKPSSKPSSSFPSIHSPTKGNIDRSESMNMSTSIPVPTVSTESTIAIPCDSSHIDSISTRLHSLTRVPPSPPLKENSKSVKTSLHFDWKDVERIAKEEKIGYEKDDYILEIGEPIDDLRYFHSKENPSSLEAELREFHNALESLKGIEAVERLVRASDKNGDDGNLDTKKGSKEMCTKEDENMMKVKHIQKESETKVKKRNDGIGKDKELEKEIGKQKGTSNGYEKDLLNLSGNVKAETIKKDKENESGSSGEMDRKRVYLILEDEETQEDSENFLEDKNEIIGKEINCEMCKDKNHETPPTNLRAQKEQEGINKKVDAGRWSMIPWSEGEFLKESWNVTSDGGKEDAERVLHASDVNGTETLGEAKRNVDGNLFMMTANKGVNIVGNPMGTRATGMNTSEKVERVNENLKISEEVKNESPGNIKIKNITVEMRKDFDDLYSNSSKAPLLESSFIPPFGKEKAKFDFKSLGTMKYTALQYLGDDEEEGDESEDVNDIDTRVNLTVTKNVQEMENRKELNDFNSKLNCNGNMDANPTSHTQATDHSEQKQRPIVTKSAPMKVNSHVENKKDVPQEEYISIASASNPTPSTPSCPLPQLSTHQPLKNCIATPSTSSNHLPEEVNSEHHNVPSNCIILDDD